MVTFPKVMLVSLLGVLLACLECTVQVEGFVFELPVGRRRCFHEEVPGNTELHISYAASPGYAQFIDAYVLGPTGRMHMVNVGQNQGSASEFISKGGEFSLCLTSRMVYGVSRDKGTTHSVSVDIRIGNAKNDYKNLVGKEKLRPMEVELRVLEDEARLLHTRSTHYVEKEAEMRNAVESLAFKVVVLGAVIIVIFVIFSVWELIHLKKYFRKKRLID
uniref:Putative ER--golgi transport protein gp25L n=1 Tax=Trypanosoma congolense (strain IL3000) TaxID=1068625 RepID=G0UV05_TRYCI|nr:putative ER--golgi transport protein gp25L [Trypanosoma congolense IL3000]